LLSGYLLTQEIASNVETGLASGVEKGEASRSASPASASRGAGTEL